ncbi:hypothetical protein NFJ02_01g36620 [Pycnococcus provasolii]
MRHRTHSLDHWTISTTFNSWSLEEPKETRYTTKGCKVMLKPDGYTNNTMDGYRRIRVRVGGSSRPHGWIFPSVHPRGGPEVFRVPNRLEDIQDGSCPLRVESCPQTLYLADAAGGAGNASAGQRVILEI